jgi:CxxC motif-containing protein (DUF1111 family)
MKTIKLSPSLILLAALAPAVGLSQTDPGVRGGAINGNPAITKTVPVPVSSVSTSDGSQEFFDNALTRFQEVENLGSTSPNGSFGLGPRFNFNSCSGCHAQPTIGGSGAHTNPQFLVATPGAVIAKTNEFNPDANPTPGVNNGTIVDPGTNTVPFFITKNGPTREARFPFFLNADGSVNTNAPNGGVETIFTVAGRTDGGQGCTITQPDFAAHSNVNDLIFRIPTPLFGAGMIENLDDSTLLANLAFQAGNSFGIGGTFNTNGNDGTITKFGWKAQNKSLQLFAGEAYNVEMGITNEIFNNDRPLPEEDNAAGLPADCLNLASVGYPEDTTNFSEGTVTTGSPNDQAALNATIPSDIVQFSEFTRLLAPPLPAKSTASTVTGGELFSSIGCATCHTPTLTNPYPSQITAALGASNGVDLEVNAFSDVEVHHMGTGLADNVSQGGAGGDQFRTSPLWGVGQRIFFLHDGRTTDIVQAIQDHSSSGSEANTVIANFNGLTVKQQQDIVNFLRSL